MQDPPPFRWPSPGEAFAIYVGACFVAIVLTILALVFFPWSLPIAIGGIVAESYWLARWFNSRKINLK